MEAQFNFLRVKKGKSYFARVAVASNPQIEGIKIDEVASAQIPGFKLSWLEAALLGAKRALQAHIALGGDRVGLEVTSVLGTEVDTRNDTVEVAAYCAAWNALGRDASTLQIVFNDQWRVS